MACGTLTAPSRRAVTAAAVAAALLLLCAAAPARALRGLQQSSVECPDLMPGGTEATVKAPPRDSTFVAAFANVGPFYVVAAAQDGSSPEGPSQFEVEVWDDVSGDQVAGASSADGCATSAVVDRCQAGGPIAVTIRLRCLNQDRPCQVLLASYMSPCAGGPQPEMVGPAPTTDDSSSSTGVEPVSAPPPGVPAKPGSNNGNSSSSSSSGGGISKTTWMIIAVCAAAGLVAVVAVWCLCRRCNRRRLPSADLESGNFSPLKPTLPQQQQFVVSGGSAPPAWQPQPPHRPLPQPQQQQQQPRPLRPQPLPGAQQVQQQVAGTGPVAQDWAFAYKVAGGSRTAFATHSGWQGAVLQEWDSIDGWLARVMERGQRWDGCLYYNDSPPEGCARPVPYQPPGHAKGVLLWSSTHVGFLVHSVPKWPFPGVGRHPGALSPIDDPQTVKGQSFLWLVLPASQLPTVLQQLRHMQVLVYHVSDSRVWPHPPEAYTQAEGRGFRMVQLSPGVWHLCKSNEPHANFYDYLARRFGAATWLVRSNQHTNQGDEAKCASTSAVQNVARFAVPGSSHAPYLSGSEHAKLAVCCSLPMVLVGDLNNTKPQHKRGGGGLVLRHPHLAAVLLAAAVEVGMP